MYTCIHEYIYIYMYINVYIYIKITIIIYIYTVLKYDPSCLPINLSHEASGSSSSPRRSCRLGSSGRPGDGIHALWKLISEPWLNLVAPGTVMAMAMSHSCFFSGITTWILHSIKGVLCLYLQLVFRVTTLGGLYHYIHPY